MSQDAHPPLQAFIHAMPYGDEYMFAVYSCDMSSCGYIPIEAVTVPTPNISLDDIKSRHLVLLKLKREEVYTEAAKTAKLLDDQIARLECITYTPTPVAPADDHSIPF